jgi:hypothetical protein
MIVSFYFELQAVLSATVSHSLELIKPSHFTFLRGGCAAVNLSDKEQSLTVPCVLLWPTYFVHTEMLPVECSVECSRLRASRRLWLPFIASLHYINLPKLAKSRQ